MVFASDWPVSPIDPIAGIQAAVVRKRWADDLPDHAFSLHEAIAGYTVEGAYAQFAEHRKGHDRPRKCDQAAMQRHGPALRAGGPRRAGARLSGRYRCPFGRRGGVRAGDSARDSPGHDHLRGEDNLPGLTNGTRVACFPVAGFEWSLNKQVAKADALC